MQLTHLNYVLGGKEHLELCMAYHSKGCLPAPEQQGRLWFRIVRWNEKALPGGLPTFQSILGYWKKAAWELLLGFFLFLQRESGFISICVLFLLSKAESLFLWRQNFAYSPQSERRKLLSELIQTCVHGFTVLGPFLAVWNPLSAKVMWACTAKSTVHHN